MIRCYPVEWKQIPEVNAISMKISVYDLEYLVGSLGLMRPHPYQGDKQAIDGGSAFLPGNK